jgi:limonene-1,2-epoxide hydrolase
MFAALDRESVAALFPYLHDDVIWRFASYPVGKGKNSFAAAWSAMSGQVKALEHTVHELWSQGEAIFCHGEVSYHRLDAPTVTVPFANVFRLRGEKIAEYLIYVDASAVFGAAPTAAAG